MRAFNVSTTPLVLSLAALLAGCVGGGPPGAPGAPGGVFGPPPPPHPSLFISPFGEPFVADPDQPYPSADWFTGADDNLDGAITFEEFSADGQRYFATLDTDRDGRLTQTELAAYEVTLRGLGGMGPGRGGERQGRGFPVINVPGPAGGGEDIPLAEGSGPDTSTLGAAPQTQPGSRRARSRGGRPQGYGTIAEAGFFNLPQPVKSADVNVDQRVTAQEWAEATQRWFRALDTDRDGKLTLATLPITPAQAAAARRR
ncbi:MAG: hypothetical protein EON85_07140 [Brevundimonas sp.]|nr:MAG: hypothetical protein EON85_07140 [Brevundimonas sp.]